MWFHVE
jgi:hypothetical protein